MAKRLFLSTLVSCLFLLRWTDATKPNIVFIMGDDLGWNDVGFHNSKVKSPNIDALKEAGIRLTSNYAAPVCSASRSALMTGKDPHHNGFQHMVFAVQAPSCLPLEHTLLPKYMKNEGYVTKMLGKWHLGYCAEECLPTNRGWDEFRGILGGESDYYNWEEEHVMLKYVNDTVKMPPTTHPVHLSVQDKEDVVEMISDHAGNSDPLFLFVSPNAPHSPMEVTPEMYEVNSDLNLDPRDPDQNKRRKYLGLVYALDEIVGATVQALKDADMLDNTVIVFQSDNGGSNIGGGYGECYGNNYPLRNGKASPYEGGVKVPSIYYDPRLSESTHGTDRDFLMHITDWLPTFLELAGGTTPTGIDGLSQISNLGETYDSSNKYTVRDRFLVSLDTISQNKAIYRCTDRDGAYRYKDWKLVYGKKSTWTEDENSPDTYRKPEESPELETLTGDSCVIGEGVDQQIRCLFNIENDPSEQHNLYNSEPDMVEQLLAMLNDEKTTIVREVYTDTEPISEENTINKDGIYVPRIPFCNIDSFPLQDNYEGCDRRHDEL
ncbi:arylsulfatase B-like [Watersipora subatra]|uniref:arylsulfatase B-like n=1 Tax=Watersipora subatra TaxID=2589382 RepID=UPI00355C360B